jgi:hypothetical protein
MISITAAGTNPLASAYKPLPGGGTNSNSALRLAVTATGDPGASAFNLWAALIDDKYVHCVRDIACTKVTSARKEGTTGDYVCDVDVAGSGKDILDVLGAGCDSVDANSSTNGKLRWVIGCKDAAMPNTGTTTAINIEAFASDKI